jgi:hypothetical protein
MHHLRRGNLDRKVISPPKISSDAARPESDGAVASGGSSSSRFRTMEDAGTSGWNDAIRAVPRHRVSESLQFNREIQ